MTTDQATATTDKIWVVSEDAVRHAIRRLIERRAHPFFLGYVHLRQQAARINSFQSIPADWPSLGRVLEVPDALPNSPYLKPFQTSANRDDKYQWWNGNIAGSWSPASLRPGMGPLEVVSFNADKTYNLRTDHPALALEHLLYGAPMSAVDFAVFMFRDYGLVSSIEPSPDHLVANLRLQYGIMADDEFQTVYDPLVPGFEPVWFEALPEVASA